MSTHVLTNFEMQHTQNATYFDSFGVEHIPKKLEKSLGKKIYQETFTE